jgi:hypothetical protein
MIGCVLVELIMGGIGPPLLATIWTLTKFHPLIIGLIITPLAAHEKEPPLVAPAYRRIAPNELVRMSQLGRDLAACSVWRSARPQPPEIPGHSFYPRPNAGPLVALDDHGFGGLGNTRRPGLRRFPSWWRPGIGK